MLSGVAVHVKNEIMLFRERLKIIVIVNINTFYFRIGAGSFTQLRQESLKWLQSPPCPVWLPGNSGTPDLLVLAAVPSSVITPMRCRAAVQIVR